MSQRFLAGLLAALITTFAGYLAYLWVGIPYLPAGFSDLLFKFIPGGLQAEGIAMLGSFAKPLALYLFMLCQMALLGIATLPRTATSRWLFGTGFVLFLVFALLFVIDASPNWSYVGAVISLTGLLGVQRVLFNYFNESLVPLEFEAVESEENNTPTHAESARFKRRQFLTAIGTGAGAVLLWPLVSRTVIPSANAPEPVPVNPISIPPQSLDDIPGLQPALTPMEDFYYVSKNLFVHRGNANEPLVVDGLVENPVSFSIEELREMETIEAYVTLMCVDYEPHNSFTNDLIGNALWKGVPLTAVLGEAGVQIPNSQLAMHATDGFSTAIPLSQPFDVPETMIAIEMNGQKLDGRHGFPARLIAPGIYGYKNIKHINKIEVVDEEFFGYWESRGWAVEAPVKLMSRISTPSDGQRVNLLEERWIAGIAYSGRYGISSVEVSLDDGLTWDEANVEPPLSQYSWSRWAFRWLPERLGETVLLVRATDKRGELQESAISRAFPSGATGYHRVRVQVVES